jgi:hypothetical protein
MPLITLIALYIVIKKISFGKSLVAVFISCSPSFDRVSQHVIFLYLQIRLLNLTLALLQVVFKIFHLLNSVLLLLLVKGLLISFLFVFFIYFLELLQLLS